MAAPAREPSSLPVLFLAAFDFDALNGGLTIKPLGWDRQVKAADVLSAQTATQTYGSLQIVKVSNYWVFHLELNRTVQSSYRAVFTASGNTVKLFMLPTDQLQSWNEVKDAVAPMEARDFVVGLALADLSGSKGKYCYALHPAEVKGLLTADTSQPMWVIHHKKVVTTFEQKS